MRKWIAQPAESGEIHSRDKSIIMEPQAGGTGVMPDVTEYDKMPGCFLSRIRNIDEKLRNIVPKIRQNDRKIRSKKNELCGFRTTAADIFP